MIGSFLKIGFTACWRNKILFFSRGLVLFCLCALIAGANNLAKNPETATGNPNQIRAVSASPFLELTKEQLRLFESYVKHVNEANKSNYSAREVFDFHLNQSEKSTFIAITHALENSFVTGNEGKSVAVISLVDDLIQITGEQPGRRGAEQFRLLVKLKNGAVERLLGSPEFTETGASMKLPRREAIERIIRSKGVVYDRGHIYRDGRVEDANSLRQIGIPSLQISYLDGDPVADIDIDYRELWEGHDLPYNSDVRAIGPERENFGRGGQISNFERHNLRYGRKEPFKKFW